MANSVRVKQEMMENSPADESPGDQVLDLRKSNSGKQLCIWCMKKKVSVDTALGDDFCSEVCFEQFRRDSFKKRSSCFWCSNNNSHGIMSKNLSGNLDETKFCSDYCLAQFKDVQVNGSSGTFPVSTYSTGHKDLITPDLWLRKPTPGFSINPIVPENKKSSGFGQVPNYSAAAPSVLDSLFVANERVSNSALSPRSISTRHGGGVDQLSPSCLSVTSSRRPSSPSSSSIHSLSPMPSPVVGVNPRKRNKPQGGGGTGGKRSSAPSAKTNYRGDGQSVSTRGRKAPPSLLAMASGQNGLGQGPLSMMTSPTMAKKIPAPNAVMFAAAAAAAAQGKDLEDKMMTFNNNNFNHPSAAAVAAAAAAAANFPIGRIPNGQRQARYAMDEGLIGKNPMMPNPNLYSNSNRTRVEYPRIEPTVLPTNPALVSERLEAMLPKVVVLIPYPIPFPIPFPVRVNDLPQTINNVNKSQKEGGDGIKRVLNQLDETD